MADSSDALRGVRFQTATAEKPEEKEGKRGICRRLKSLFRWGRKKGPESILEAQVGGRPVERPAAPFVVAKPEHEYVSYIQSLPNGQAREYAAAAVRRAFGDDAPTLEQAKAAIVCDTGNGGQDMQNRKDMLFALAFHCRKEEMMGTGALSRDETVNVFYYRIDLFSNLMVMLRRPEKEEGLRSKCEDRLSMLQAMERLLLKIPPACRIDAFVLMAEITMKMGETPDICTKEVCMRMENILGTMASEEGDKMAMLAKLHANVIKTGFRPSGRAMASLVPRAEKDKVGRWINARPEGGVREAAEAAWKRKPGTMQEFMLALETEPVDMANRRLHVLEEVVGEDAVGTWVSYQVSDIPEMVPVAWNIGYFCIYPIRSVADFAKGMENEAEVRLAVLDTILWIARRMPPGMRMEAPGKIASAVERLSMPDEQMGLKACPKEWILTYWMAALKAHMHQPNPKTAFDWLSGVLLAPLKVVDYKAPE